MGLPSGMYNKRDNFNKATMWKNVKLEKEDEIGDVGLSANITPWHLGT